VPAVKATTLVEVVDPAAKTYGVKRPFVMKAEKNAVEPGSEFQALVGTGYDAGRAIVEISQAGQVLKRFWTEPGRTQWPVAFEATAANRGGFTVRAWMVRDGRLHMQSQTVDVPWTDKKLAVEWERFTRRTEPGAKEVWRAKITSVADPVAGPATPQAAEMLALMYDQSLDALSAHAWPGGSLMGLFRRESGWLNLAFTNGPEGFHQIRGSFAQRYQQVPEMTFRVLRDPFGTPREGWGLNARRGMVFAMAGAAMPAPAMMADAAPMEMDDGLAAPGRMRKAANRAGEERQQTAEKDKAGDGRGGDADGSPASQAAPPPRKNLVETAFFLPTLSSAADGIVTIEFTLPDTLTTWQFKSLAHDAALRSGQLVDTCISAKDLMVEPLVPRFLREGDLVKIPVKVSNTSTGRLAGTVRFALWAESLTCSFT